MSGTARVGTEVPGEAEFGLVGEEDEFAVDPSRHDFPSLFGCAVCTRGPEVTRSTTDKAQGDGRCGRCAFLKGLLGPGAASGVRFESVI